MLRLRLRKFLREFLEKGFWFHRFQRGVERFHQWMSGSYRFKRWVAAGDVHTRPGAPELYQIILLFIAITWVAAIRNSADSVLASLGARIVGIVIAGYFIVELLFFLLDWVFVKGIPIEDYRRSLATLIVSSAVAALLFYILFSLGDCRASAHTPLGAAYNNWLALLKLELVEVNSSGWCEIFSNFQWWLGALIIGVLVVSLVGQIIRPERKKNRSGKG